MSKNKDSNFRRTTMLFNVETLDKINILQEVTGKDKADLMQELIDAGLTIMSEYAAAIEDFKQIRQRFKE